MRTAISETDWSAAKRARAEAAQRRRRVIFNTDAEEMTHEGANTVDGFLAPQAVQAWAAEAQRPHSN